jgi:hypothetical protein
MKKNWFDPHKAFFELKVVIFTLIIVPIISILTAITIVHNSSLQCDLSHAGFNNALVIFKFPIAILASLIPLIAILAANHRSEQQRESIRLSQNQNTFSNYYKHVEEFEKHIKRILDETAELEISSRRLYSSIFKRSKVGIYNVEKEAAEGIYQLISLFKLNVKSLASNDTDDVLEFLVAIDEAFSKLKNKALNGSVRLKRDPRSKRGNTSIRNRMIMVPNGSIREYFLNTLKILIAIDDALRFDIDEYSANQDEKLLKALRSMCAKIPSHENLSTKGEFIKWEPMPKEAIDETLSNI